MKVADVFREQILSRGADAYLGSEDDLIEKLAVSRPTFREAARLLEYEQLLTIKRGPGGGYFTREPTHAAVTHVAAVLLRRRAATMADISVCAAPLMREAVRLAALGKNPALRRDLRALVKPYSDVKNASAERVAELEAQFIEIVARLGGNPVLELFVNVIFDFGRGTDRYSIPRADRREVYCEIQVRLIEAILDADPELAQMYMGRRSALIQSWIADPSHGEAPDDE
jgi:DNA-binding FadR family transcriptional regulator